MENVRKYVELVRSSNYGVENVRICGKASPKLRDKCGKCSSSNYYYYYNSKITK